MRHLTHEQLTALVDGTSNNKFTDEVMVEEAKTELKRRHNEEKLEQMSSDNLRLVLNLTDPDYYGEGGNSLLRSSIDNVLANREVKKKQIQEFWDEVNYPYNNT